MKYKNSSSMLKILLRCTHKKWIIKLKCTSQLDELEFVNLFQVFNYNPNPIFQLAYTIANNGTVLFFPPPPSPPRALNNQQLRRIRITENFRTNGNEQKSRRFFAFRDVRVYMSVRMCMSLDDVYRYPFCGHAPVAKFLFQNTCNHHFSCYRLLFSFVLFIWNIIPLFIYIHLFNKIKFLKQIKKKKKENKLSP